MGGKRQNSREELIEIRPSRWEFGKKTKTNINLSSKQIKVAKGTPK